MIRASIRKIEDDAEPHAIFFREIRYFSAVFKEDCDDLDYFEYCMFEYGNLTSFDIRRYRGDPASTSSLYLPINIHEHHDLFEVIDKIIEALAIPKSAIGWKRDRGPELGVLKRDQRDRLREKEARVLALKIASQFPNKTASTAQIKKSLESYYPFTKADLVKTGARKEEMWKQIVGNVISHRSSKEGPFVKKYATRTDDGLTVTERGMNYLKSIGFLT